MFLAGIIPSDTHDTPQYALGTVATNITSGVMKVYKYLRYTTAVGVVAAVSGNVAYYHAPGGVSTGQTTQITSDVSESANLGAGVLQSAPTNLQYCWVQIKGPATLTTALTSGGDGQALTPVGTTDGTLKLSALQSDAVCAFAVKASSKIVLCEFPF